MPTIAPEDVDDERRHDEKAPPLHRALATTDRLVGDLADRVRDLHQRLAPLMRPALESVEAGDADQATQAPVTSELVARIGVTHYQLATQIRQLDDLLVRLEA